jgi:serine/threonine protein kinase
VAPTERRQRITAVFEQAKKLRPEDQGQFLERECGGDKSLIEELKALLSEHREAAALEAPRPVPNPLAGTPIPRRIGRYEITGKIGSGGFGHVYSALDPAVDRPVAIKMLNAPGDPDLIRRFRAEAMTVAKLHHKNIVTVHEFGEEDGAPYLVMELLEGMNVEDLIRRRVPLSLHEKLWIMSEVAEGLQCAHGRGVIHRDVKPANIMRLSDGSVKIMDFGIARIAVETATRLTQTGFVVGSLMYMAPEQFNGTADVLSDIFAYGVTFYELLTGQHPFASSDRLTSSDPGAILYRIINVEPAALHSLVPDCQESIERIVNRTLAKSRDARYSGMADVVADIKPILLDLQRQQAGDLFSQADQLLRIDQLDAAHSRVRKVLELDPWHAEARQLRDRIDQALQRRNSVDRAVALLDRAEQELSQREFNEAAECLATVKRMSLGDTKIDARLDRAYARIEQARNAVKLLDVAREDLKKENLTEASRGVSDVLASDPDNRAGQQLLQEIQTRMAAREAERKIQEVISRQREEEERQHRIREVVSQANALVTQQKPDAAVVLLRQAIEQGGEDAELRKLLDNAESQVRDHSRSVRIRAIQEQVEKLIHDQRWEDALHRTDEALNEFPDVPLLVSQRASLVAAIAGEKRERAILEDLAGIQSLQRAGRFREAAELLEKSLGAHGDDVRLLETRELLSKDLAERQRAEYLENLRHECRLLLKQGRFDDAFRLLEGCEFRYPDSREASALLAEAKAAREAHERTQSIGKALARASEFIHQADYEAGLSILESALKTYPDSRDLAEALARTAVRRDEADRRQEIKRLTELIERAIADGDWDRATNRIADGLDRFPEEASLVRLKHTAEDGKHRKEVAEIESSAVAALKGGNSALAAEIIAAARIRWPDERKISRLHQEVELSRAEEDVSRAKELLRSGRYDEAEQLGGAALKRWPKLASAADLLDEIEARKAARSRKETPVVAGPPAPIRRSWPRVAIWAAAAVLAVGGLLYWVATPHPKPEAEKTMPAAAGASDLRIAEPLGPLSATIGSAYALTLRTSGGSLPAFWAVTQGSLPPGLSLDRQAGRIEGTPDRTGTYTFVAQALDSGRRAAQRVFTITVNEPQQEKTLAKQAGVAEPKRSDAHRPASPGPQANDPTTVAAQADVQTPCKAKSFILDQYGDSRSGELTWNGLLSSGGQLEIKTRHASIGFIRGDTLPPGVPVHITVTPEDVRIVAAPSVENCWDSRLLLQSSGPPASTITVRWVVYQP